MIRNADAQIIDVAILIQLVIVTDRIDMSLHNMAGKTHVVGVQARSRLTLWPCVTAPSAERDSVSEPTKNVA